MITFLKRIFRWGIQILIRDGEIALANIIILFLTISLFNVIFLTNHLKNFFIAKIQEKADVSVYFKEEVPEEEILKIRKEIASLPEIEKVTYISRQEALDEFLKRHQGDPEIQKIVQEIENPFLASIRVVMKNPEKFEIVLQFFEKEEVKNLIDNIDYLERKPLLEKISSFSKNINHFTFFLSSILIFLSILVTFITIRLGILNFSEEISIQRYVGASNLFIRGPFIVSGLISGLIAGLFSFLLFFLISFFFSPKLIGFLGGFHLFNFFQENLLSFFLINFVSGSFLATSASFFALNRYLKL